MSDGERMKSGAQFSVGIFAIVLKTNLFVEITSESNLIKLMSIPDRTDRHHKNLSERGLTLILLKGFLLLSPNPYVEQFLLVCPCRQGDCPGMGHFVPDGLLNICSRKLAWMNGVRELNNRAREACIQPEEITFSSWAL